uniref:Piezo type mechanosensitive ion channel component 1 (Er blood group) n=1 Tax=Paramormyrops kingsleyae TaxID=1676925 RepID=A0A3B3S2L7_9TELE
MISLIERCSFSATIITLICYILRHFFGVICSLIVVFLFQKYPQRKGQKKKKIVKYGMGGLIIVFLICIIWFPLLFISLVRSVVGVVNHPVDVTVTVKLGGYEPLFTMSVQQQSIQPYTEDDYNKLSDKFSKNAVAMQFISLYSYEDVVTANIEGSSGSVWRISPPSRQEVIKELLGSPMDMTLRLTWDFQRDLGKGGTVEHTSDTHSIDLAPDDPVRAELASLLVGNRSDPVLVPHMFPNYIRAPNGAEAKPVSQLYEGDEEGYESVTLTLLNGSGTLEWWDISIAGCSKFQGGCQVLPMVIFNDKDHGAVCVGGAGDRQVRARLLQRDLALHNVRGAAVRGPHPQAVQRHLPGALRQAHLPLPFTRDDDQVDPGERLAPPPQQSLIPDSTPSRQTHSSSDGCLYLDFCLPVSLPTFPSDLHGTHGQEIWTQPGNGRLYRHRAEVALRGRKEDKSQGCP